MKQLTYAGGDVLTGTAIAEAVMDFAEALARHDDASQVTFPALGEDGSILQTTLLIGPASQIVARDVEVEHDELVDDAAVRELRARIRALRAGPSSGDHGDHDVDHPSIDEF
ncbi:MULTISPECIES: hypothetical protein [unclassified Agromyces]|uniref:hypothetical protein n=1 Tax=unclassified Agromyces TaxID=2639701 RepID=UPI0007B1CEB8|nr:MULTISPECIES: hypothetical protein [unclassified Agromyces]KZE92470.1 hypothetical protein AVP42_02624 [Agromyces sp. NDB4Y10]MCK8610052.1 hypothetical protein [Agromyces sp. C10]